MANLDNPKGFLPVAMLNGSEIPVRRFSVDSSNATAIFIGDLVIAEADGRVAPAAAACGDVLLGACVGVYDSNGVPCGAYGSSVSAKYLTASTAGYVDVALALPEAVFRVQCLTGATPAATDVFASSNHTAGAGDTTLATSNHELTATFATATQFKMIGRVEGPNNDWGEHVDVLVVAALSYWHDGTDGV